MLDVLDVLVVPGGSTKARCHGGVFDISSNKQLRRHSWMPVVKWHIPTVLYCTQVSSVYIPLKTLQKYT